MVAVAATTTESPLTKNTLLSWLTQRRTLRRVVVSLSLLFLLLQGLLWNHHQQLVRNDDESSSESSSSSIPKPATTTKKKKPSVNKLCSAIIQSSDGRFVSTSQLWQHYLPSILQASIHPKDVYWQTPKQQQTFEAHYNWTRDLWQSVDTLQNMAAQPKQKQLQQEHDYHYNWTKELLQSVLQTHILAKSLRALPMDWEVWRPLFLKLQARMEYSMSHQHTNALPPPPIKIIVFGGSIVEGAGCDRSPRNNNKAHTNTTSNIGRVLPPTFDFASLQECAWPYRLERMMNQLLGGGDHVQIHNLAVGGTHSEAAIPVLDYWLSPVFQPNGADLIINAYSANDNLPPAYHGTTNTTIDNYHLYRILERNVRFVQAVQRSTTTSSDGDCRDDSPPKKRRRRIPILYVNDYLGNQQDSIWGEGSLDEMIQLLADYSIEVGYVSPAHMVKSYVMADTTESFFSGQWFKRNRKTKLLENQINVHFGMAGHVTTMIAVAYWLLHVAVEFCNYQDGMDTMVLAKQGQAHPLDFADLAQVSVPSKEWVVEYDPEIVLPSIVEHSWTETQRRDATRTKSTTNKECHLVEASSSTTTTNHEKDGSPCLFAFLAAPLGTHQRDDRLQAYLDEFRVASSGSNPPQWIAKNDFRHGGFQNKLGVVPAHPSATITLEFADIAKPVRFVTIHYLKSYGSTWQDSRARFTVLRLDSNDNNNWKEFAWELEGSEDGQKVSISYTSRTELPHDGIPIGGSFQLKLELIGGQTFKINALMLCER